MLLSKIVKPVYIIADKPICNGSLLHINDKDYLIARYSNYSCGKYFNGIKYYCNGNIFTDEIIYNIDLKTGNTKFEKYLIKTSKENKRKYTSYGFEDIRIIKWNNINSITSVLDKNHNCQVYKFDLCDDFTLKNGDTFKTENIIEKNWQPIETKPNQFIYSYKPFKIFDFNSKKFNSVNNNCINYSGSSQVISLNDVHNLSIVHTRQNRTYTHYFVLYDKNLKIVNVSKGFSFTGIDVEFNCFIEKHNDTIRILAGINDSNTLYFELPIITLYDIITGKIYNNEKIDYVLIDEMYHKNMDILSKLCLATYTNDKNIIASAIELNHKSNLNTNIKTSLQKTFIHNYKGLK